MSDAKSFGPMLSNIMDYVRKHAVVSAEELALAVSMELSKSGGSAPESAEPVDEQTIVAALTSPPNGGNAPRLAATEHQGVTFYHDAATQARREDLDAALSRMVDFSSIERLEAIEDIVGAFLSKSGYEVMSRPWPQDPLRCRQMMARKPDRQLDVFIFPSIGLAPACAPAMTDDRRDWVIAAPTESSPGPFLRFCKEKVADFADRKLQVWVVDRDKKSVNPFLGYTRDDDVYRNFENPKLASFACRWYGVGKELWVRPSL